ncbi:Anaerobic selenocysteine-containing dehydrogenase [Haloechinothrix alba]|uniref:Anaerobic selenocysteine-containing dehydrogenase n=1 Tax=Haloechinothrix alba TaxID=664784 RepID=A0A238YA24_9PSEU|nr:molybdopterin-dependent oxidoreductase [Haloechinothrix alba]SNR67444.1 Anaerobic selenocysteine-containing dehydrogenase [Haloechinothrix alba]
MPSATVTCPLCEATCGLRVTVEGDRVTEARGDPEDVFSHGYVCPKGASLPALHHDPDRLRTPLVRRGGSLVEATWDEAFAEIDARLRPILAEHGPDSVAVYAGNPAVHNLSTALYGPALYRAIGTKNFYTAGTVDQIPKHFSSGYLFGHPFSIPVPDVDRTQHLLVLGANPLVSNGSLMTAPNIRKRLRALGERGGKLVVVDPRHTRTTEIADEHHAIRPGTDALLLFAMVNVLFAEGLAEPGELAEHVNGQAEVRELAQPFTPEAVAGPTGIAAGDIRRMAVELARAESAAVYGRIGTTTQSFGTLTSWLVDVVNVLTGNLDRPGGAMFPQPAAAPPASSRPFRHGRWHTRVRGLPEVFGEAPVATLADEIRTPGEGQVRALLTVCGNPAVSSPNAGKLTEALGELDFMVSLDIYVNETSRHADVILPGPTPLERPHYDIALYQLAVRNVANWTPAALESDLPQEWRTMLRLTGIVTGQGPDADVDALDEFVAGDTAKRKGVDPSAVVDRTGPERMLDIMLRSGPYELTLADLETAPHGVDLGPLRPRVPGVLNTASGRIELAPEEITSDVPRLAAALTRPRNGEMVLIGRRHLSSNNSWMHNLEPLVRGSNRCTAQVHPDDAGRLGLRDGGLATVSSRAGKIDVRVEVATELSPGVVSIPHGWGHDVDGVRTFVAAEHAGVNSNILTDEQLLDALSGTAVLNGIPIEVAPAG